MTPTPEQRFNWDRDLALIADEAGRIHATHRSWCCCSVCHLLGAVRDARWQLAHNHNPPDLRSVEAS